MSLVASSAWVVIRRIKEWPPIIKLVDYVLKELYLKFSKLQIFFLFIVHFGLVENGQDVKAVPGSFSREFGVMVSDPLPNHVWILFLRKWCIILVQLHFEDAPDVSSDHGLKQTIIFGIPISRTTYKLDGPNIRHFELVFREPWQKILLALEFLVVRHQWDLLLELKLASVWFHAGTRIHLGILELCGGQFVNSSFASRKDLFESLLLIISLRTTETSSRVGQCGWRSYLAATEFVEALDHLIDFLAHLLWFEKVAPCSFVTHLCETRLSQISSQVLPHEPDLAVKPDEVLEADLRGKVLRHVTLPKELVH